MRLQAAACRGPEAAARTNVRRMSVPIAVAGFFVLAFVGWASGVPPFTCAIRALIGAAVLYVLVTVAGRLIVNIVVESIIRDSREGEELGDTSRDGT